MSMTVNGMGQRFGMHGAGAIDGTSAELNFRLGSMPGLMATQLGHATIKEIVLEQDGDYVIYMQAPTLSSGCPAGRRG